MKKIFLTLAAAFCITGWYGCSEDFTVAAPYKNITLVYGMVNMDDTAHYIRIQKAFLDDAKSAINMAAESDSSFFQSLDVSILELTAGVVTQTIPLASVDLAQEGYVKDSGVFFRGPQYAYKFKHTINPSSRYRILIRHPEGNTDSAEIDIINAGEVELIVSDRNNYNVNFDRTIPLNHPANSYTVTSKVPPTSRFIEIKMRFHWMDKDIFTAATSLHFADFTIASQATDLSRNYQTASVPNINFYSFLRDAIKPAPDNLERYMGNVDIHIYTAGEDFLNYVTTTQIQSTGLTADQLKPTYTNIHGNDVYGIFTSRSLTTIQHIPIHANTIDSLKVNTITAPLRIKGKIP